MHRQTHGIDIKLKRYAVGRQMGANLRDMQTFNQLPANRSNNTERSFGRKTKFGQMIRLDVTSLARNRTVCQTDDAKSVLLGYCQYVRQKRFSQPSWKYFLLLQPPTKTQQTEGTHGMVLEPYTTESYIQTTVTDQCHAVAVCEPVFQIIWAQIPTVELFTKRKRRGHCRVYGAEHTARAASRKSVTSGSVALNSLSGRSEQLEQCADERWSHFVPYSYTVQQSTKSTERHIALVQLCCIHAPRPLLFRHWQFAQLSFLRDAKIKFYSQLVVLHCAAPV